MTYPFCQWKEKLGVCEKIWFIQQMQTQHLRPTQLYLKMSRLGDSELSRKADLILSSDTGYKAELI